MLAFFFIGLLLYHAAKNGINTKAPESRNKKNKNNI